MADCWSDGLAGLATDQGIDERDCLVVDIMYDEVADW